MSLRAFLMVMIIVAPALAAAQQRVAFRILDKDTGEPFPARIHLKDDDGKAIKAGDLPFHRTFL